MRYVIYLLIFIISTTIHAGSCRQCYMQKTTLFMNCLVNRNFFVSYKTWCVSLNKQLLILRNTYKAADKLINERPKGKGVLVFYADDVKPVKRVPYDSCDACYNDVQTLNVFCHTRDKSNLKHCEKIATVSNTMHQLIKVHPYVLSEPIMNIKP